MTELTDYSESIFFKRSLILASLCSGVTLMLTSATEWQYWLIIVLAFMFCLGLAIQQATLIEYGIMLGMIAAVIFALSTTEYFDFHWSVIVSGILGSLQGMMGRDSRYRHQFRTAYGDEEYKKRYNGN